MEEEKSTGMHDLETVILCGGQGSRLGSLTSTKQKCMIEVNGKPFLTYIVGQMASFEVHDFVFATGKGSEEIEKEFSDIGIISKESEPLGTGGAVKYALKYIKNDHFMVVNGDSYLDIPKDKFQQFVNKYKGRPLILLNSKNESTISSLFGTGYFGYYGAGFYIFSKSIFDNVPYKCSLEHDCISLFIDKEYYMLEDCQLIDIGTPGNLKIAESMMRI